MKVIELSDRDWELLKAKLMRYLHCQQLRADLMRYQKKASGPAALMEAKIRKEHIQAIHLVRAICEQRLT